MGPSKIEKVLVIMVRLARKMHSDQLLKKSNIITYSRSIAALWFLPKNFEKKSTSKTLVQFSDLFEATLVLPPR